MHVGLCMFSILFYTPRETNHTIIILHHSNNYITENWDQSFVKAMQRGPLEMKFAISRYCYLFMRLDISL